MIVTWLLQRLTNALYIWFCIEENNETRGELFSNSKSFFYKATKCRQDNQENAKMGIQFYWLISLNSKLLYPVLLELDRTCQFDRRKSDAKTIYVGLVLLRKS